MYPSCLLLWYNKQVNWLNRSTGFLQAFASFSTRCLYFYWAKIMKNQLMHLLQWAFLLGEWISVWIAVTCLRTGSIHAHSTNCLIAYREAGFLANEIWVYFKFVTRPEKLPHCFNHNSQSVCTNGAKLLSLMQNLMEGLPKLYTPFKVELFIIKSVSIICPRIHIPMQSILQIELLKLFDLWI